MSYSVDTSAILEAWVRKYPPDVFPTLWNRFDEIVSAERMFVIDEVTRELARQDDGILEWIEARPVMIVALNEAIQQRALAISAQFPTLVNTNTVMSGAADPFVIALAQEMRYIVVMAENSKPTRPRIPDACNSLTIPCITLVDLFRREGWRI